MPDRTPIEAHAKLRDLLWLLAQGVSGLDEVLAKVPEVDAEDLWAAIAFAARKALSDPKVASTGTASGPGALGRQGKPPPPSPSESIQLGLFVAGGVPPTTRHAEARPAHITVSRPRPIPSTDSERIALFRELFHGREDVFAVRWEPPDGGKAIYFPRRRGGKNGPDLPLTDREVSAHLAGGQVIGTYPLLQDDSCWFLAFDFDKACWREDLAAFRAACTAAGIPCAVEISRSGNGAHAWFFFSAPVPAVIARRFGCHLLTLTASRRGEVNLSSYDRLFPSQDSLPEKGYGNLIALPLQGRRTPDGCSVFVDEGFVPFPDQWAFLAAVPRLDPLTVTSVAESAERQGLVYGYLPEIPVDEEAMAPWERPPSGRRPAGRIPGPLPPKVKAVLAQRLFIERRGLPPALVDRLRRLAAFKNPVFFRNQKLRKSNHDTPMFVCCTQEDPDFIGLPRGCEEDARRFLSENDVVLDVEDRRTQGKEADWSYSGNLRPMQARAVAALVGHHIGVYVAPPGTGKTVVGVAMIAKRKCSTLVLVHRQTLLDQWRSQLAMGLGLDLDEVGQIGGGKRKPNGMLDVVSIKSLIKGDEIDDRVANYGFVIVDECHHVPAFMVERVLAEAKAKYVLGLTATPHRQDGHHPILHWQCGPTRFEIKPTDPEGRPPYRQQLLCRSTSVSESAIPENSPFQVASQILAANAARNSLLVTDIAGCLDEGRYPVVLSKLREHLDVLAEQLRERVPSASIVILRGAMNAKERKAAMAALGEGSGPSRRVILATGSFLGEGFDEPRLDTLFLALPVSWKGLLVQYAGRIHRFHPEKTDVRIYDYVDDQVPPLRRMFEKRLKGYRTIGYVPDTPGAGDS